MDRSSYNKCMAPYMRGSKTKEQRQKDMCAGAKICTKKASTREEADRICAEAAKVPKPIKVKGAKRKGQSCEKRVLKITECMVPRIDMNLASNINSIGTTIANAMMECTCPEK